MSKFNLANILTTLRILLILPFAYFLLQNHFLIAGILIIVATLLDYENWLTKKTNDNLAFKNMYDKIADIIIITAAILLVVYIKFWFMYEALIAIGAILVRGVGVYLINRKYNFIKSTHWTKAAGLLLIIGVAYSMTSLPGLRLVIFLALGFNVAIGLKRLVESFEVKGSFNVDDKI